MTEAEACRLLCAELPPEAHGCRRALRAARYWGAFPRAYTAEHHRLGRAVLDEVKEGLRRYRFTRAGGGEGRLPPAFVTAVRELLACLDREGVLV